MNGAGKMSRRYDTEYRVQAVKLAKEIGIRKPAEELGITGNKIMYWVADARRGKIDLVRGSQTPESTMSLAVQIKQLPEENKALKRENKSLREDNEILEDAVRFFRGTASKFWFRIRLRLTAKPEFVRLAVVT
jgi:transposase